MNGLPNVHAARLDALAERIGAAVSDAGRPDAVERVHELRARLREPLRVAIAGRAKSGKSTLLNALVGEIVAPTDASECTRVVTWYRDGPSYAAAAELTDGTRVPVSLWREPTGVTIDLHGLDEDAIERVVVDWPNAGLRRMRLIDTPGIGSVSGIGRRTARYLTVSDAEGDDDSDAGTPADAVLYLTRHVHRDDVAFLEAFHDRDGATASPVNAIGVLARADEIGGGRLDALVSAAAIARRTAREPAIRRLCRTVVPLAGLVAEVSSTLTEAEYRAVRSLAGLSEAEADELLLSVDRFTTARPASGGLSEEERAHLLGRFGLFGLRLARGLVRDQPALTARGLATELGRASGLEELHRLLTESFAARRDTLKLRSGLTALEGVVQTSLRGDEAAAVTAELESLRAAAHELAELDAVLALRRGDTGLDDDTVADAEALLQPGDVAARLGMDGAEPAAVRRELIARVAAWRAIGEHPLHTPDSVAVAATVVRTLEGLAVTLS